VEPKAKALPLVVLILSPNFIHARGDETFSLESSMAAFEYRLWFRCTQVLSYQLPSYTVSESPELTNKQTHLGTCIP
jgi:hypothetical protein